MLKFVTEHIDDMSKEIYNLGQWMDFKRPYRTLDKSYMETGWWVFKKATDKGLLYHDKYLCMSVLLVEQQFLLMRLSIRLNRYFNLC